MKKSFGHNCKKLLSCTIAALTILSGTAAFADDEDDDFYIPIDIDLSQSAGESTDGDAGAGTSGASKSSVLQGIWIEATSKNSSLIRDVASGEVSGYEFDNSHFMSNANWWFWGDINKNFHLDAEISVWDFDKTLYQSNSYAANVADVTWGDGLQSLLTMPFSFIYNGNDDGVGALNKLGFTIATPYVETKFGYGCLKNNGMSEFTGIYNVLDRWLDVGNGFTEVRNGKDIREFGDFTVDAVAALSMMRGTYGTYDYIDVHYSDKAQVALTFGSTTTESQLFFYNRTNTNAVSAYGMYNFLPSLSAELHGLYTFGTSITPSLESAAQAVRVTYTGENFDISLMESFAGEDVTSVWGCDGQSYDNINADTSTTQLNINADLGFVGFGFDEGLTLNDVSDIADGLWTLRNEPYVDLNFMSLNGIDVTTSFYGAVGIDRLAASTSDAREFVTYLDEAGVEVVVADTIPFIKKLSADYAVSASYNDWSSGNFYEWNKIYHSIMLSVDVTDNINVHFGSIIRQHNDDDATVVPFGAAVGTSIANLPIFGHPKFWVHFTYGMNPYEDNNYSLYRADDPQNKAPHRTYLLHTLDEDTTTSEVAFGLIWDL